MKFRPKIMLSLVICTILTGCVGFGQITDLTKLSGEQIDRFKNMAEVDRTYLPEGSYKEIAKIKGLSCKGDGQYVISEEEAREQLYAKASILGANAVTDVICYHKKQTDWENNCWESYICTANALKISDPKLLAKINPEISPDQTFPEPVYWRMVNKNETDFRKYFDEHLSDLDPIEGIWNININGTFRDVNTGKSGIISEDNAYRIAIVKDSSRENYQYIAIVLESIKPEWKAGTIKAYFRKTSHATVYEGLWYMVDYSEKKGNYIINRDGFIEIHDLGSDPRPRWRHIELNITNLFIKAYPPISSKVASQNDKNPTAAGTGFVLDTSGLIVTNYHVVKDAKHIEIVFPEKNLTIESHIKIKDAKNDIAILGLDNATADSLFKKQIPFSIGDTKRVKIGQRVFTLGFPLGEIMGSVPRASAGNINSLYGIRDDPRLFQVSTPIQPGNSGGPLFNETGEVIGIVVSSLSAKVLYENAGIIPQNVNFALKSEYLRNLISMLPDADEILYRKSYIKQGPVEVLIEQLTPYIVQIKTY